MSMNPPKDQVEVASHELLAVCRPPAKLPNGKNNPEYTRWYRQQKPQSYQTYNASEKAKACRKKYRATDKAQVSKDKRVAKKRNCNEIVREDQCKCAECGMVFDKIVAALEGFRHLARNRYMGICGLCNYSG